MPAIAGIVFDKDGTLFDFRASWGGWTARLADDLADGDPERAARLCALMGYDRDSGTFAGDSPVIAETPQTLCALLAPHLPGTDSAALLARMDRLAADTPMVPAVPLVPLLADLKGRGLRLGLVTNDAETAARAHLEAHGVAGYFDVVFGYDSGHRPKPAPDMLRAFLDATGIAPSAAVMVGDSLHDLTAGRAAGMTAIGVLTGPATAGELAPAADAILPDIGQLPGFLDNRLRAKGRAPLPRASSGPGAGI